MSDNHQHQSNQKSSEHSANHQNSHHHIVPEGLAVKVFLALLGLTALTVITANIDLGVLNFPIAITIATVKALLVVMVFMALKWDSQENIVIFSMSFVFLGIFLGLLIPDLFFRGNVYTKKGVPLLAPPPATAGSTVKQGWVSTPQLIAKGKEVYAQCAGCHGPDGKGDGAAAASLTPKPRNFTQVDGWKNGRKPSEVFRTLKDGIVGSSMASYSALSTGERWALVHYVRSLAPNAPEDTKEDLAKIGIDPTKPEVDEVAAVTIPIELAMERMVEGPAKLMSSASADLDTDGMRSAGSVLYQQHCLSCHGPKGSGGVRVRNLGVKPAAWLVTRAVHETPSFADFNRFSQVVARGIQGDLMPGLAHLSSGDVKSIYDYLKSVR
jgi:caa(3)-type oxidase subunit IV